MFAVARLTPRKENNVTLTEDFEKLKKPYFKNTHNS